MVDPHLAATHPTRRDLLSVLRSPRTIRARCAAITQAVTDDRSGWFRIDRSRLPEAAARVVAVMRRRFPDLRIPIHSRWRHFEAGGIDRKAELDAATAHLSVADRARAHFDLTVVSVLLDAGAGAQWGYVDRLSLIHISSLSKGLRSACSSFTRSSVALMASRTVSSAASRALRWDASSR